MEWSEEKNILLIREVLNVEPFNAKERTTLRAQLWQKVADNLNRLHCPKFKVDKRAVRDHLNMIIEKYKKRMKKEENASGISPELTEEDALLEEVIERIEVANEGVQLEKDKNKEKMEKEKKQAEDIRLKAMEKLAESKKRGETENEESKEKVSKKRRSNGTDTVNYLRERAEIEQQYRERELEIKNKQLESSTQHKVQSDQQHHEFIQLVLSQQQQQQQQHQQQMQQFQMMLTQQQQQQQQLLLALLNKNKD